MVSFRDHQFRAVLLGLIMADAVSWAQLSARHQPEQTAWEPSNRQPGGKIDSHQWCHQIVAKLRHPEQLEVRGAIALNPLYTAASVESLLSMLPEVLLSFDRSSSGQEDSHQVWHQSTDSAAILFYQCLMASLNEDFITIQALRERSSAIAEKTQQPLAQAVDLALEQSLLAQGDFELSVGQSGFASSPLLGLPLLTGTLSAARVGLSGLPLRYQQALATPVTPLQVWLNQRWQITTTAVVTQWAQGLWRQWLGCDPVAPQADLGVAVRSASLIEW